MPGNNTKTTAESPRPQTGAKKHRSIVFSIVTFFSVILVIALIFGGAFYFVIHNNVNGLAEKYRKSIQGIPVARLALPAAPDPLDPRYMTDSEIRDKYTEFRKANEELRKQLDESEKKLEELQKYKDEYEALKAENDKAEQDIKTRQAEQDARQVRLDELKAEVDSLIASGNKEGLKQYFETLDPETAKQIYTDVVKKEQTDANTKKFAQLYAAMDAAAAAGIFEELGNSQIDLIARTLKAMSNADSSEILAAMAPDFAAKVTQKLDELYKAD
jgi:flagellar motility protein MotE (MotC chaperone)